jgi:hypothetical protein
MIVRMKEIYFEAIKAQLRCSPGRSNVHNASEGFRHTGSKVSIRSLQDPIDTNAVRTAEGNELSVGIRGLSSDKIFWNRADAHDPIETGNNISEFVRRIKIAALKEIYNVAQSSPEKNK